MSVLRMKPLVCGAGLLIASASISASEGNKFAFAPVFAYDPVFETILGAALFSYPDQDKQQPGEKVFRQGFFMGTFDDYVRLAGIENRTYADQTARKLVVSLNNFFDYEFPEGSDDYVRYDRLQASVGAEWSYPIEGNWSWFTGARVETEQHDRDGDASRAFPTLGIQHDRRDRDINSSSGDLFTTKVNVLPEALHSNRIGSPGWNIQSDYRHYLPVFKQSVLASRVEVQATDGEVFNASLG